MSAQGGVVFALWQIVSAITHLTEAVDRLRDTIVENEKNTDWRWSLDRSNR